MDPRWRNGLLIGATVAVVGWMLDRVGVGLPLLLFSVALAGLVAGVLPRLGVELLDRVLRAGRAWHWRREEGRHHAHAGVMLEVEDDGRHVWLAADGLGRVLGRREADDIAAARHAGRWRRDDRDRLWLRVDAVVAQLATGPGRMDPRTVRLRRYLERDVLFPAAERRRRSETMR